MPDWKWHREYGGAASARPIEMPDSSDVKTRRPGLYVSMPMVGPGPDKNHADSVYHQ